MDKFVFIFKYYYNFILFVIVFFDLLENEIKILLNSLVFTIKNENIFTN